MAGIVRGWSALVDAAELQLLDCYTQHPGNGHCGISWRHRLAALVGSPASLGKSSPLSAGPDAVFVAETVLQAKPEIPHPANDRRHSGSDWFRDHVTLRLTSIPSSSNLGDSDEGSRRYVILPSRVSAEGENGEREVGEVLAQFQATYQAFRLAHDNVRKAHEQLAAAEVVYVRTLDKLAQDLDAVAAELTRHLGGEGGIAS